MTFKSIYGIISLIKKRLFIILLQTTISVIGVNNLCAQTTVCPGDTALIILNSYRGSIQWQASTDSITWDSIPGETSDTLQAIIDTTSWYRAEVIEGTCLPVYSAIEKFIVNPVPAATAGSGATETQITANWNVSAGATTYYLDVSALSNFASYVSGYNNLNVGNVTTYNVTGLTWYYRIRAAADSCGISANSNTITYFTAACIIICGVDSVQDADGNWYNTVLIGTQCWMAENLNVGTQIPPGSNQTNNDTIEKYCHGGVNLSSTEGDCSVWGGLYQWNEMMQYTTIEGTQGVCPMGWHLPSNAEWTTLKTSVGNDGNALKAIGQGFGAGAGTNTSGFSGLLAGIRNTVGTFNAMGTDGFFWTSTESGTSAMARGLANSVATIYMSTRTRLNGYSVRCLKD